MRLLVVTPFYPPDLGPSAPLLGMLCEDLAAMGHEVMVLAAVPHFPSGQVAAEYRGRLWQWERRNGVQVGRVWVPSGKRANLLHRLLTFLVFQMLATAAGLGLAYNVALITNPALETFLPFAILSWLRRKPSLFCVWDVYPDVGVRLGIFRHATISALVGGLEDFCLHRAKMIQVLSDSFKPSLQARHIPVDKLAVIPPWLDADFIRPLPRRNAFSREHNLDDRFVVLYAGNLGFSQGLEEVLQAARRLETRPDLQFVMIGDGPNRSSLVAQASELGLSNVKFMPFQPRERLPEVLATADLALVSQQCGLGNDSLPSKTFPILASGRPVLAVAEEGGGLWRLVGESQAGICIPPSDPDMLAQAVWDLAQAPARRQRMGEQGREYALRHHSRVGAARHFERVLKAIMDHGQRI
jgi:colanic acid biosynthesis glycosyl transferase WcaI